MSWCSDFFTVPPLAEREDGFMRIGFIGAGNMASAILRGIKEMEKGCYDVSKEAVARAERELGAKGFESGAALCAWADLVVLAVKPQVLASAVEPLKGELAGKAVASIAAGWTLAQLAALLPESRVCRVMPNTPAMVGEGMTAIAKETTMTAEEFACVQSVFAAAGRVTVVPEGLMTAVTAVSGSGPAYVCMVMEAMADAGVREGLSRAAALELAAQTVLGTAKMVLQTGTHPAVLRDMVCSPAGTTIEAVSVLEEKGLRAALEAAVRACAEKAEKMAKQ
jgi:pyrroline-5-carboxylate reductase